MVASCPSGCFFFFLRWSNVLTEWLWTNSSSMWPTPEFLFSSAGVPHFFTGCCFGGHSTLKPTLLGTFRFSISLKLVAGIRPSSTLGVRMLCLGLRNRAFCMRFRLINSLRILALVYWGQSYTLELVVPHCVPYQNK